jgi:hypothetical protein
VVCRRCILQNLRELALAFAASHTDRRCFDGTGIFTGGGINARQVDRGRL